MIKKQLRFEFADTLIAMVVGWAINSAIILVAASVFHFSQGIVVTELSQAQATLRPLAGEAACNYFCHCTDFCGILLLGYSSDGRREHIRGTFQEPFDIADNHSRTGIIITILGGLLIVFFIGDPFQGLIWSQIALDIQLPWTIFALIFLTSSSAVMGKFANYKSHKMLLWIVAAAVSFLNIMLLIQVIQK